MALLWHFLRLLTPGAKPIQKLSLLINFETLCKLIAVFLYINMIFDIVSVYIKINIKCKEYNMLSIK